MLLLIGALGMKFFESHTELDVAVYRSDVLAVLDALDEATAPLQTLCNSPRQSLHNDEALKMLLATRRCIADVLAEPELTDEDDAKHALGL